MFNFNQVCCCESLGVFTKIKIKRVNIILSLLNSEVFHSQNLTKNNNKNLYLSLKFFFKFLIFKPYLNKKRIWMFQLKFKETKTTPHHFYTFQHQLIARNYPTSKQRNEDEYRLFVFDSCFTDWKETLLFFLTSNFLVY